MNTAVPVEIVNDEVIPPLRDGDVHTGLDPRHRGDWI